MDDAVVRISQVSKILLERHMVAKQIRLRIGAARFLSSYCYLFFSFLFLATSAFSEPQPVLTEETVTLRADQVTLSEDNILTAEGNVELTRGKELLKATKLIFIDETEEVFVEDPVMFLEGQTINISGDEGELDLEMQAGLIKAANILVDEKLKIRAKEVFMEGGEVDRANDIWRVTTCEECKSKNPLWHFSASSAVRNSDRSQIMYKNVVLRVKGVPVAFTPYLRLPDPRISRARGFLMPSFEASSKLGTGIRIPYFVPFEQDKDLLLTPLLSNQTNTLEYRYRQAYQNGNLIIIGALSKDALYPDDWRYYLKANGSFVLDSGYHLNFQAGKVSDDGYLGDYGYYSKDKFETYIAMNKEEFQGPGNFKQSVKFVRNDFFDNTNETEVTISADYSQSISQNFLPGQVSGSVGFTTSASKGRDEQVTPLMSEINSKLTHNYATQIGKRLELSTLAETQLSILRNPENEKSSDPESRLMSKVGLVARLPFYHLGTKVSHTFEPMFTLSYGDQSSDVAFEPFRASSNVNVGELHRPSSVSGFSEEWKGWGGSLGLNYLADWQLGYNFRLSAGIPIVQNPSEGSVFAGGPSNDSFAYVLGGAFSTPKIMSVGAKALFNSDRELVNATSKIGFNFALGNNWLANASSNYNHLGDHQVNSEISLSTAFRDWKVTAKQSYLDGLRDIFEASATYEDECTRFVVGMNNRFSSIGSSGSVQTFSVSIQLKR